MWTALAGVFVAGGGRAHDKSSRRPGPGQRAVRHFHVGQSSIGQLIPAVKPPSTRMVCPVTNAEAGEAR
jgi:hypothetical protein